MAQVPSTFTAFPQTSPADIRAIRREEAFRSRELADLPDSLTDAEYEEAESAWLEAAR